MGLSHNHKVRRRREKMKKTQVYIAGALSALAALVLVGVAHLAFVFPKTMAVWKDEGRALSNVEQSLANLSGLCTSFGLLLIPILLLAVIGCGIWAVVAGKKSA
jgi:type II secretory pathway component PulF